MPIKNIRSYENQFLIYSAILVAILHNLPFLMGLFNAEIDHPNPFKNVSFILTRSPWYIFQAFISVLIFSVFNFRWKKYFIGQKLKMVYKITLLVFYNSALVFLVIVATIAVAEYTVGNPFGINKAFYYYFWKYLTLFPISLLLAYVLHLITKAKIIEVENIKLKEENLTSQLKSLKDQINPHFLFNTLNTLCSIIRLEERKEGLRFVDDLSNVYRYILESDENDLVNIGSELDFLTSYIYMLKKRFGENLSINIDIDKKTRLSFVPPMALQVLVENAIKHNEVSSCSPLSIRISVKNNYIIVENNIKIKSNDQDSLGLGLPNLIKRYELLNAGDVFICQNKDQFIVKLPIIKQK
jgi:two-component system, LytTR family, sensor kinase